VSVASPARFPGVRAAAGHYESYYLKACHPDGGLGVWIRYTVHKPPGAAARGFLWFTLFDAERGVMASKVEAGPPSAPEGDYVRLGSGNRFAPGKVSGQAVSTQLDAVWDLRFHGDEPPVWHLPQRWMYGAPFPRTKVLSPHPHVLFEGRLVAGERTVEVVGWPGTVGHNWGSEHARRAIWLHGANFEGQEDAWLDVAIARVGLGPLSTPWIANGELALDGRRYRLGGLRRPRAIDVDESPERCRFRLTGDALELSGEVGAPRERFVSWLYAQPRGGERQTVNCSIADMELTVARPGRPALPLELHGGAAYELQMSERYPPIPLQPFPDG
jgi:hypothetical protein